jgi:hypothetical protein
MNDPTEPTSDVARAIAGNTHFPANGARVVIGWTDDDGHDRFTDEPVLWFENGGPVVVDGRWGVETLDRHTTEPWFVYHPDTRSVGFDFDPVAVARADVAKRLSASACAKETG